jgi:hypothetical protein
MRWRIEAAGFRNVVHDAQSPDGRGCHRLFQRRTGNAMAELFNVANRQLLRALRGETDVPGSFTEQSFEETAFPAT